MKNKYLSVNYFFLYQYENKAAMQKHTISKEWCTYCVWHLPMQYIRIIRGHLTVIGYSSVCCQLQWAAEIINVTLVMWILRSHPITSETLQCVDHWLTLWILWPHGRNCQNKPLPKCKMMENDTLRTLVLWKSYCILIRHDVIWH